MVLFKKRYLKNLWKVVIVLAGLSFLVGQVAIYIYAAR